MTRQTECIGSLYAEFLAAGDYDNARGGAGRVPGRERGEV